MTLIRYRVWENPPSWKTFWRTDVRLGEFDFYVMALIELIESNIRHYEALPALKKFPAQVRQNQTFHDLLADLRALPNGITAWQTSDSDRIWWLVDPLVFDGSWAKVRCFECERDFVFSDCRSEDWSVGESLFAEGGRLLKCAQGHLLCRSREWNS